MMLLLVLAPGVIGYAYYCYIQKISFKPLDFIIYTTIFSFFINIFILGIAYLRGHGGATVDYPFSSITGSLKYGGFALIASFAFPSIAIVLSKFKRGKRDV